MQFMVDLPLLIISLHNNIILGDVLHEERKDSHFQFQYGGFNSSLGLKPKPKLLSSGFCTIKAKLFVLSSLVKKKTQNYNHDEGPVIIKLCENTINYKSA